VKDPRWKEISIKFCGGTYVQKTGDIKDLVILEESGIAKGVRRIIAVTGEDAREDAHEVQRTAKEFEERLTRLEQMGNWFEERTRSQAGSSRSQSIINTRGRESQIP